MDDVTALKHHVISDRPDASTSHPLPREKKSVNINTSLSTLSPAHYEAMNSPASPLEKNLPGGRPLTMRDVVLWQQEQAQHRGELGFTTNFADPSTIFKPFNTNASSEDDLPAEDDAALIAAMQETHRATVQLQQRKIIMDGAQPLLAKTETDVTRKLLAEGVALQELQNKGLRQKIVQLVELKKPPPKANFVSVVVSVASTIKGQSHMLEINLPLKACVEEIYALLDQVIKVLLSEKGLSYERGGIWKYQLIDHNRSRLLMDKSLPIGTDLDYKKMLQQVSKVSDGKAPVAVLTQGGLARPVDISGADAKADDGLKLEGDGRSDAFEVHDEDDDELELLDEDGKPYFEPLEMNRLLKKYADLGDDLTEKNGIHGFWR